MKAAREVPLDELPDPLARNANLDAERAGDRRESRARPARRQWLVMVQCARISAACRSASRAISAAGSAPATARTTTRRAASAAGPAPENLAIPPYAFTTDTTLRIG